MKFTVLGYQSPYPGPGGATPGYLLETSDSRILIDCGSGVISQLGKYINPWELSAVVLSHLHHDHAVDIPILHYALLMGRLSGERKEPLAIYAPSKPKNLVERLSYESYTKITEIDTLGEAFIGNAKFEFLKTQHDIDCYGMLITSLDKTICYTADTGPETDWSQFGSDVDLLIVEGTFLKKDLPAGKRGHLSVEEAARLATSIQAKKCIITHLYPLYKTEDILAEATPYYEGQLYVAELGLTIEV